MRKVMSKRQQGPYVKKLIALRMSQLAVPKDGGFADGIAFLTNKDRILRIAREATDWAFAAIYAVKAAPGGKVYGDDEDIAKEILRQVEVKTRKGKS